MIASPAIAFDLSVLKCGIGTQIMMTVINACLVYTVRLAEFGAFLDNKVVRVDLQ